MNYSALLRSSPLLFAGCLLLAPLKGATPEEKIVELGLQLPPPAQAVANYVPAVRTGSLIYLAGHLPRDAAGKVVTGKLGQDVSEEAAVEAARLTGLALLGTLQHELGSLDRVRRVVRVGGFVNATTDFSRHSIVINGCSDLLVAVFGEKGRHARAAVGVASLPLGAVVEIELVVEVE